jgi:hypothetical protein
LSRAKRLPVYRVAGDRSAFDEPAAQISHGLGIGQICKHQYGSEGKQNAPVLFGCVFFFMLYYGQNCQNNFYNQSEIDGAKQHKNIRRSKNISSERPIFSAGIRPSSQPIPINTA